MMKRSFFFRALALTLSLLLLAGCAGAPGGSAGEAPQRFQAQFLDVFDTVTTIVGYAESEEAFSLLAQQLHDRLLEYHRLYDIYQNYEGITNLKTINDRAGMEPVPVDECVIELLQQALRLYQLTDGRVNVAMGSVLSLWHDYRQQGIQQPNLAQLPPLSDLRQAAQHTDISQLHIDEQAGTVRLADPEMSLDVGAVAKGYAVEQVARWAETQGYDHLLLSVGGNVRAVGGRTDGSDWQVGVQNPDVDSDQELWCTVELHGQSLVTSGVYQRYYTVGTRRYHHIIHPQTLMPSDAYWSVSVVGVDSGLCDALSTALFNMTLEEGQALIESLEGVEALWILSDGSEQQTDGFAALRKAE